MKFILKKRSILFHIIMGYLTGGIWLIIYFICKNIENSKPVVEHIDITSSIINKSVSCNDYVIFDFETTGLNPNEEKITEFTFLKFKNNKLVDEISSLVNPEKNIPNEVSKITGITNEMVKEEKDIKFYINDIMNFIDGYTLIGHNICNFDIYFLKNAIEKNVKLTKKIEYKCIDTLTMSRELITAVKNYKLETLKKYLKIDTISHRSKQDCEVTAELYQYMIKKQ